jgi:hypothetical protein
MQKLCAYCGEEFEGAAQARYCSNAHRVADQRRRTEPAQREVAQEKSHSPVQHPRAATDSLGHLPSDVDRGWGVCVRWQDPERRELPVYEPNGPAGLSLIAFPNQTPGDMAPSKAEREKLGLKEKTRSSEDEGEVGASSVRELTRAARAGEIVLTASQEQMIRDHWGYGRSEQRTLAQRDEAARGMLGR